MQPPKMSSLGGGLWEVAAFESLDHSGSKYFSSEYGNSHFREKNPVLPVEKCSFLVLARNTITLVSIFCSIIRQLVAYGRLKTKESFKLLALKVVAAAC